MKFNSVYNKGILIVKFNNFESLNIIRKNFSKYFIKYDICDVGIFNELIIDIELEEINWSGISFFCDENYIEGYIDLI